MEWRYEIEAAQCIGNGFQTIKLELYFRKRTKSQGKR